MFEGAGSAVAQQQPNSAGSHGRTTAPQMAAATAPAVAAGVQDRLAGVADAAPGSGQTVHGDLYQRVSRATGVSHLSSQDQAWGTARQLGHNSESGLTATPAVKAIHSSTGGRRLKSDFASLLANLPDVESLMSEEVGSMNSLFTAAQAPATAAVAVATSPPGSGAGGNPRGLTGRSGLAANCFYLPVELCLMIRGGNLQSIGFAYPYVLGYMPVVAINILQTLMSASKTGALVLDAQLLLILAQQFCLVVALLGGLGLVISLDRLYRMLPM